MWLSDARNSLNTMRLHLGVRPLLLRAPVAVMLGVGVMLGGCGEGGFRPLNASVGLGGANVDAKLASVLVAPIPGRLGQRVRNELIFDTTGGGAVTTDPTYRLEMAVKETVTSTLVKTDGDALSQVYSVDATFNLIRIADKTVVLKGVSYGRAGFERNPSIFSNVRAQDDAQNRVARTIGMEMRTRLAAFLATAT
jgi:LPS-assembly lipoprotein